MKSDLLKNTARRLHHKVYIGEELYDVDIKDRYEYNPYYDYGVIDVERKYTNKRKNMFDPETKRYQEVTVRQYYWDFKIKRAYLSLEDNNIKVLQSLKAASTFKVFFYIVEKLNHHDDLVELPVEKVCSTLDISRSSYYLAITELTKAKILARKKSIAREHLYFVNPFIIFRGSIDGLQQVIRRNSSIHNKLV